MTRRLVASYVAVAVVILAVLEVPLGLVYARHERDISASALVRDAESLAAIAFLGLRSSGAGLDALAQQYRRNGGDVAIFGARGGVVIPPAGDEAELLAPPVRSQVHTTLAGGAPSAVHTIDRNELFAVALVGSPEDRIGAVAVTADDSNPGRRVHTVVMQMVLLAAIVIAAVAALGWLVARSASSPLTALHDAAVRLGRGDLTARSPVGTGPPEMRALSTSFNTMAVRLEELVDAHKAFAGNASHQLRSPLTALRLRLENIAAGLPEARAGEVGDVLREVDRLTRTVEGLLALARTDGQRPDRATVDLASIVADRHAAWHPFAEERGVELVRDDLDPALAVWAVPGYIEQILDNLISNAIEATPAGREIRLAVTEEGDRVVLHVVDQGVGMTDADREHAFDRFWRGADRRAGRGTGLGLAIVGQLARASGATVELLPAPSGGVDAAVGLERAVGAPKPALGSLTLGAAPPGQPRTI